MRNRTVAETLAVAIDARRTCIARENDEWRARHQETIERLVADCLPSGSGVDSGCQVDLDRSTLDKIVITTSYHHMDDGGSYDGWTDHVVTVRPSFIGLAISISGRNRNVIKDYLTDLFNIALSADAPMDLQPTYIARETPTTPV